MITRRLIKNGIRAKLIQFVVDPNMESGTVCQIGDNWFYFGGLTAEELNPEEYISCVPEDDIVNEIFETLDDFRNDEELKDEYGYYESVLSYINQARESIKVLQAMLSTHQWEPIRKELEFAIQEVSKCVPTKPIQKRWSPNRCPCCGADLGGKCDDGYYQNPYYEFCPECRQVLDYE